MCGPSFDFVYVSPEGTDEHIDAQSMRRIWVDQASTGIVFAEPGTGGSEVLHEIVLEDSSTAQAMTEIMETLLATSSFERVERPIRRPDTPSLVLEFRHPQPSEVALTLRA